jgi:hypothetical protein
MPMFRCHSYHRSTATDFSEELQLTHCLGLLLVSSLCTRSMRAAQL